MKAITICSKLINFPCWAPSPLSWQSDG